MTPTRLFLLVLTLAAASVGAQTGAGGRLEDESHHGASLEGNLLGETSQREVLVYLPPGYDAEPDRRYPLVILLHAWGVGPDSWLGGERSYEGMDVTDVLDELIGAGAIEPLIVALPDARTSLGGSWYVDSPATGRWEDYVSRDLVEWLDDRYRTLPDRASRGIVGQSMGGYGALRVAMRNAAVFGAVLPMSAPVLVDPNIPGDAAWEAALEADPEDAAGASLLARLTWSKAVAFSPDPTRPPLYARLPAERADGGIRRVDHVWQQWLSASLTPQVPGFAPDLRTLRIRLEVGADDPLRGETEALAGALEEHDVPHEMVIFEGDHTAGVRARFETAVFQFFDSALSR